MNKTVVLAIAFVVLVLIVLVYTTMGNARYRCEVCIVFQNRTACRTAAAATRLRKHTASEREVALGEVVSRIPGLSWRDKMYNL